MRKYLFVLLIFPALLLTLDVHAQCTSCAFTATTASNGTYTLTNQKLCIASSVPSQAINFNGSSNSICVGTGATWTQNNSNLNFNIPLVIDVYGTFVLNGNYNYNSQVTINVYAGGVFRTDMNGTSGRLTINNFGTVTYTTSAAITNAGSFTLTNYASATLTAPNTSLFLMNASAALLNYGTMSFPNFENQESDVRNFAGSSFTIGTNFYNHGNFVNDGTTKVCPTGVTSSCGFRVGNKGPGKTYTNNGCMTINGDVTFDGPGYIMGGTLEILTGNLTLNNIVSGTNGRIIVGNGLSLIASAGQYIGTNMKFCDRNPLFGTNRFDLNLNFNNPSTYTVDCSDNTCEAICSLVVTATPGSCTSTTNQYRLTGTVSLTNNSAGGTMTVADGASSTTITVPANTTAVSYTLTGLTSNGSSHTVTATLAGCGSDTQTYTAPASCSCTTPVVSATSTGPLTCTRTTVTVSASSTASATYRWSGPNSFTANTASFTTATAGTYSVTVTTTVGGCTATATTIVTSSTASPVVSATNTGPLTCTRTSVTVSASSTASATYRWSGPNSFTANTASFTTAIAGTYSVTTTNPTTGCTSVTTTAVTSNTLVPTVTASNNGPLTCTRTSVTLSTTVSNATNPAYQWSTGAITSSITTSAPGIYSVQVTSANGCTATAITQVLTEAVVLCPKVNLTKI